MEADHPPLGPRPLYSLGSEGLFPGKFEYHPACIPINHPIRSNLHLMIQRSGIVLKIALKYREHLSKSCSTFRDDMSDNI